MKPDHRPPKSQMLSIATVKIRWGVALKSQRWALTGTILPWSDWERPSACGTSWGTKVKNSITSPPVRQPARCCPRKRHVWGTRQSRQAWERRRLCCLRVVQVSSPCVGRTIFPIPRLAPFVGRWDTRFILAFSGAKHPAIVEASAQRTLRLLALCRGSGSSYCVLVPCTQLLARSRLVLGPCGLCWPLLDGVSHPSEV